MKISSKIRKAVGFVGYIDQTKDNFVPVGSFFYVGHDPSPGATFASRVYAVTARHVIDGLRKLGVTDVQLRVNKKDDTDPLQTLSTEISKWVVHPSDDTIDAAVLELGIPGDLDHLAIPYSMFVTPQVLSNNEVDLGDEVFISGLFKHHYGGSRNIPIVRVGNLAALNEEKVSTKEYGLIDAYLVEARSIGGLSGSPAFLNLGHSRMIDGRLKAVNGAEAMVYLLGLVHGHFDTKVGELDISPEGGASSEEEKINSGIAIVVPISHVRSIIEEYEAGEGD